MRNQSVPIWQHEHNLRVLRRTRLGRLWAFVWYGRK